KEDSGPADQAKLAQEAQIPMEQAIQTAVAIHPGVVIESVLVRERGLPMYRIVVLDKDSADGAVTFFLVNAHDGQIVKNENRKIRVKSPE
ncbi:MAG TPA: PepSY domain-containing protein, partial [Pyrinomonadaceae bacterium]